MWTAPKNGDDNYDDMGRRKRAILMHNWSICMGGMYEHAGDVAADNEAPVMYHRILVSATSEKMNMMMTRMLMVFMITITFSILQIKGWLNERYFSDPFRRESSVDSNIAISITYFVDKLLLTQRFFLDTKLLAIKECDGNIFVLCHHCKDFISQ